MAVLYMVFLRPSSCVWRKHFETQFFIYVLNRHLARERYHFAIMSIVKGYLANK